MKRILTSAKRPRAVTRFGTGAKPYAEGRAGSPDQSDRIWRGPNGNKGEWRNGKLLPEYTRDPKAKKR